MLKGLVIFTLILVLIPVNLAANDINQPTNIPISVDQQNRFLSAESVREIRAAKEEMLEEMKQYQDDNFAIFDTRMALLVDDMLIKFILAGLGAFIAGGALTAWLLHENIKKFALERYVELAANIPQQDAQQLNNLINPEMQELQQKEWYPQPEASNLSAVVGQERASNMTTMNEWQAQPAYGGSWKAPIQTQPEYAQTPYGYEESQVQDTPVQQDPYESVQSGGIIK